MAVLDLHIAAARRLFVKRPETMAAFGRNDQSVCNDTTSSWTFNDQRARIEQQMMRVAGLSLGNAVLAGILVGIGTYGTRYRHRPFVHALFQAANTLFLPILSSVSSSASTTVPTRPRGPYSGHSLIVSCDASVHLFLLLIWAGLVHIVGINTCTIVAASNREGRTMGLPMTLVVQAIWSTYLVVSLIPPDYYSLQQPILCLLPTLFALIFTKMALRYYEFRKARQSVALGRNPPLIVGYMKQLQEDQERNGEIQSTVELCPSLIVMGEDRAQVEKGAYGFFFQPRRRNQNVMMKTLLSTSGLVTIDKVWQFDNTVLTSSTMNRRLKEVCLSFTLFKLLRCRFAGYTVAEAGFQQVRSFFLHVLLNDRDHERVHGIIANELSFLHDYYHSSIPIHYSKSWLPKLNIFISLLTITCCLLLAGMGVGHFILDKLNYGPYVVIRLVNCIMDCADYSDTNQFAEASFGNPLYDVVPVAILLALVVLAEAREIASYIYSSWTKVALFSHYVLPPSQIRSPRMQKWIGCVLSNKVRTHWDDKMYQCSVLVLHPRRTDQVISLVMHLLRLPDRKKNVRVPGVLKARIFNAITSNDGRLIDPKTFLGQILQDHGIGSSNNDFFWACESEGISDLLLTWHIATSILEMRQGQGQQHPPRLSDDMIAATHLSRYCAYLVTYVPELLSDNDEWCKSLYKAVKKDCTRALDAHVASAPTAEATTWYSKLLLLLQEPEPEPEPKHHVVLKNGVKLGKQLVELRQGEVVAWRFLAGFWSQLILYIAPSDNLKGHAEAIARGGELITMVWALLMNVGIASRPSSTEGSSATADSV